jgi:uncharacterized membrane protein YdbT with pleckstrin-like domain
MPKCTACDAEVGSAKFCPECGAPARSGGGTPLVDPAPAAAEGGGGDERVLFEGRRSMVPSLGALLIIVLTVGLALIVYWIRSLGRHYKITSRRVVIEHGVFSKRMEQIDLYRIIDYVVERPFGQRMLGTGNLVIQSADRTTPEVHVDEIRADVKELYEQLRRATETEKQRRGVRLVDME